MNGARIGPSKSNAGAPLGYDQFAQVGFSKEDSEDIQWFKEEELTPARLKEIAPGASRVSYNCVNEEDYLRLRNKLIKLGFGLGQVVNRFQNAPQTQINARVRWSVDSVILRCIAKIAFNYLAHITNENSHFLLRPEFDLLRNYVRFGTSEADGNALISLSGKPNLGFVEANPLGNGHLISVAWEPGTGALGCYLTIFGVVFYRVVLCREFGGVWFDISVGHYFDVPKRTIQRFPSRPDDGIDRIVKNHPAPCKPSYDWSPLTFFFPVSRPGD